MITAGFGQTLMAIYQIPTATTGYLWAYYASLNAGTGAAVDVQVRIQVIDPSESFRRIQHNIGITTDGGDTDVCGGR